MKMKFTGTFSEWFGRSLIWGLVTIFTMGIGLIWVQYDFIKWVVNHMEVEHNH